MRTNDRVLLDPLGAERAFDPLVGHGRNSGREKHQECEQRAQQDTSKDTSRNAEAALLRSADPDQRPEEGPEEPEIELLHVWSPFRVIIGDEGCRLEASSQAIPTC
jgi:hypothetical protein